ncbi:hypothetical protein SUDANB21_02094 [Streptomyces sp. enrichment culture]|uniref:hypothetical protein n=1 Tax=Streptomyces sp. enrichment culture TaxID=1795815 RepID=UPI003F542D48
MRSEGTPPPVIDTSEALAYVVLRPGTTRDVARLDAHADEAVRPYAAEVLRHLAGQWAPEPEPAAPRLLTTVVTVIAVSDGGRLDCCDEDTARVWVRVAAWSPRRAFLTGAGPFVEAFGWKAPDLVGARFLAELDLDNPPGNTDTAGERLEWPGLRLAPPLPAEWTEAGA